MQECIRAGNLSKSMELRKIRNKVEFTTSTKNSNTHCARAYMLLSVHLTSVFYF